MYLIELISLQMENMQIHQLSHLPMESRAAWHSAATVPLVRNSFLVFVKS